MTIRALKPALALAWASLALAAGARAAEPGPLPPAADQALSHDILKELVEVNTTFDHGTAGAVPLIVARLKAAGFADADVQVVGPAAFPNKPNVVVRYRGTGKAKPVLYVGHLDVVEADPKDWTVDPFKLTEKDGYLYGRGTIDMKDEDAAMLDSLIRLKREGFKPSRDIIVAFTADEETGDGSTNGVNYLVNQRRDLVDAEFSINPDSGEGDLEHGKRLDLNFQTAEKTYVTFYMTMTNRGGHSSLPEPDNAIYQLAEGLVKLSKAPMPARTTATTRAYFEHMAAIETGQTRDDLLAVAKGGAGFDAAAERLSKASVFYNAMLRSTCVATLLSAGPAENALPQRAQASIQCRILPDETPEQTQKALEARVADPTIKFSVVFPPHPNPESALDPALMKITQQVTQSMWPGVPIVPVMSVGASDSVYTRAAGIPSYGLGGMFSELDDNRAHSRDERIGTTAFYEDVEFTYRLMKAVSR
ncbi:M20/M25/M40 family metallo-hydrolase [Phenylobacterium montanum]|uniref:M20/M25/M40 family metallo-hydrolase n=1 Tax=Phenylobacterium montanum TaxID=2823693 RepID=A0A975IWH4_9CAUL|nr:M20/M25/M40 family metallo-hydrolase [Caulobacter sp. S6]QUD88396.1 M20/M25/M40 family metallo-hydrolase [Caulobacter sp. S6]